MDECGVSIYMVTNDQGSCLIRTTDAALANFINDHSKGVDPGLRLRVGGDKGTRQKNPPIWTHIRKFTK